MIQKLRWANWSRENHYGKRSEKGKIVSARGQYKTAWLSFEAFDWNIGSEREQMAHQVIYFNVSVVSQRVETPVLFPSSRQQHRAILSGWICLLSFSLLFLFILLPNTTTWKSFLSFCCFWSLLPFQVFFEPKRIQSNCDWGGHDALSIQGDSWNLMLSLQIQAVLSCGAQVRRIDGVKVFFLMYLLFEALLKFLSPAKHFKFMYL